MSEPVSDLLRALEPYRGLRSEAVIACDAVEPGAVRRHAQAVMDEHPMYGAPGDLRWGGPVAPALFPALMFRRPLGAADPVEASATDPDYDGSASAGNAGLPVLEPLRGYAVLNGGSEIELYRYARHHEQVRMVSHYADFREKTGRRGPMVIVVLESEYATTAGELLLRVRRTYIWSKA